MVEGCRWLDAVLRLREPMKSHATDVTPKRAELEDVQAVIFDIYGTLLISGCGDVGSSDTTQDGVPIRAAFKAVGWLDQVSRLPTIEQLHEQIRIANDERLGPGNPKPEVDICEIWRRTLSAAGLPSLATDTAGVVRLAAEYEARSNPTWPMENAREVIERLKAAGMTLGVVSNAQVFTVPLLVDLMGGPVERHGFELDLCIYSFRYRHAKPSPRLFEALMPGLRRRGIRPQQTLYVGNDMLNDVWTASQAGIRTAWFAGDRRSCRARSDDPRCVSLQPDLVITEWDQLPKCLGIK